MSIAVLESSNIITFPVSHGVSAVTHRPASRFRHFGVVSDSFRQFGWNANINGGNAPYRLSGRFLEGRDNMTSKFMTERITLAGCGILKCGGLALRDSFVRTSEILCFGQFPTVSDSFRQF